MGFFFQDDFRIDLDEDGPLAAGEGFEVGQDGGGKFGIRPVEAGAFGDVEDGKRADCPFEDLGGGEGPRAYASRAPTLKWPSFSPQQAARAPAIARFELAPLPRLEQVSVGEGGEGVVPGLGVGDGVKG